MRAIIEEMKSAGASASAAAKSPSAASSGTTAQAAASDTPQPNVSAQRTAALLSAPGPLPIDSGDKSARAQLAFDMFIHRLRREIGSMIAVLGGLDALVFTAGIGENSADVRAAACETLAFAGVHLDAAKNARLGANDADADIASADSRARVLVIAAQEDWAIARACFRLAPSS